MRATPRWRRWWHIGRRWVAARLGRPATILLILAAVAVVGWVGWQWLVDYIDPATPEERTDLLGKAAQIAGGCILLFGAYWTAQNVRINREGQITERYTRAIDQLGATNDDGSPAIRHATKEQSSKC
jgi:hypothetical protein